VGAGEQIMARRRTRRLVPEGVPLNSRLSGNLLDDRAIKNRVENFRPRTRPSRLTQQVPPRATKTNL
jgi:hypothetical protein